jgi:gp16 family phage-associated protein
MSKTKTAEQVQREFRDVGITVAEWARTHGFDRMTVVDVLRGHRLGNYGEGHRVAVALGIKAGRVVDVKNFKPARAAAAWAASRGVHSPKKGTP